MRLFASSAGRREAQLFRSLMGRAFLMAMGMMVECSINKQANSNAVRSLYVVSHCTASRQPDSGRWPSFNTAKVTLPGTLRRTHSHCCMSAQQLQ